MKKNTYRYMIFWMRWCKLFVFHVDRVHIYRCKHIWLHLLYIYIHISSFNTCNELKSFLLITFKISTNTQVFTITHIACMHMMIFVHKHILFVYQLYIYTQLSFIYIFYIHTVSLLVVLDFFHFTCVTLGHKEVVSRVHT